MLLLYRSSDRSDLLFSAISLEIRKEQRRFDTPKVFNGSCHKLFTASLQDWLYSRERHIPDREKMTMEGHTTSPALEVSKNQWSIRQDWHVDYVSSAHMPSAFLKAKPCFLDSHAWINQEGEERHCFCYYRCLLWPWSTISPNHPFTKSGVWGFLLQSCLNLLSLLIIEHAGPQRGTHNHAKPQSGTFTNPSIMIKVIWKIDSFALALNFWMMESRPSSICRSTLSSSSKEPPFL